MARAAEEAVAELGAFLRGEAHPGIAHDSTRPWPLRLADTVM